jgi:predicted nucleic acid-binding protein
MVDSSRARIDSGKLRDLRNRMVHSNDILILQTASLNCDYFLTMDKKLLEIERLGSMRIVSPAEYFNLVEGRQ